ncbi:MAG: hypothetical protein ACYC5Y_05875 [Symbiobacteriia bacterium]
MPEPSAPRPAVATSLVTSKAPSLRLPFQFFAAALFFFTLLNLLLFWQAPRLLTLGFTNPVLLTATHLFTLGFATMAAMGALYQLVPVILQVALASEPLGFVHFWIYLAGVSLMIISFWWFSPLLIATGGTLVLTAVCLFAWNLYRSMAGSGVQSLTARYIKAGLAYLTLVATWGVLLALHLHYGFFGATTLRQLGFHLSVGIGGWLGLLIIGVAYQLVAMFGLIHHPPEGIGRLVLAAFNAGLGIDILGLLIGLPAWVTSLGLTVAGAALLAAAYDGFRFLTLRRRQKLDASFRFVAASWTALSLVVLLLLIARWFSPPLLHNTRAYVALAYLGFIGWMSLMIQGQMYKILPFLTWQNKYSARVGREKVPLLRDMFSERLAGFVLAAWVPGILLTVLGFLLGGTLILWLGTGLGLLGNILFLVNVYQIATR